MPDFEEVFVAELRNGRGNKRPMVTPSALTYAKPRRLRRLRLVLFSDLESASEEEQDDKA